MEKIFIFKVLNYFSNKCNIYASAFISAMQIIKNVIVKRKMINLSQILKKYYYL